MLSYYIMDRLKSSSPYVPLIVLIIVIFAILVIPLRVIGYGYLPMDDALRRASDGVFRYPDTPPPRRHQPQGYCAYQSCKPWLRDEFGFRCVYCLWRECWEANGHHGFGVEHVNPRSTSEEQVVDYDQFVYACNTCNRVSQLSFPVAWRQNRPLANARRCR